MKVRGSVSVTGLNWFLSSVWLEMTDVGDIGPSCDSTMESFILSMEYPVRYDDEDANDRSLGSLEIRTQMF